MIWCTWTAFVVTHQWIFLLTAPSGYVVQRLMYNKKIRKSSRGSEKVCEYLHLVENVRTAKGSRQRLILILGCLDIPSEQYKELANCIEGFLTVQTNLFGARPDIEKHDWKAAEKIRKLHIAKCVVTIRPAKAVPRANPPINLANLGYDQLSQR